MNATKEWPQILAFDEGASIDEKTIEQHYRKRAKSLHPDAGGSTEEMQQLNLAKELALSWVAKERKKLEAPKPLHPLVGGTLNPYGNTCGWSQAAAAQSAANSQQAYGHQVNAYAKQAQQAQSNSGGWLSGMMGTILGR